MVNSFFSGSSSSSYPVDYSLFLAAESMPHNIAYALAGISGSSPLPVSELNLFMDVANLEVNICLIFARRGIFFFGIRPFFLSFSILASVRRLSTAMRS